MAMYVVNSDDRLSHNVKTAAAMGAVATGIQTLLLPSAAKERLKNAIIGEDKFLKNTEEEVSAAAKSLKQNIDVKQAVEEAKKLYPGIKNDAKQITKGLASTFAFVALSIMAFRFVEDKICESETKNNLNKLNGFV